MSAPTASGELANASAADRRVVVAGLDFGLDLLRHVFCVAVIVQHMASASRYSEATQLALAEVVNWVDGAVLGFFLVSGFLFRAPTNLRVYAWRQAARLLLPFVFFSLVYAVALALLGKASLTDGLIATLLLQGAGMQLYFLPYLAVLTVLCAASLRLKAPREVLWWVASVAAFVLALSWPTPGSSGPTCRLLPLYLSSFLLGVGVRHMSRQGHGSLALSGLVLSACALGTVDARFNDLAAVVALLLAVHAVRARLPAGRLPGSGGVYLLHTPVVNFAVSVALVQLGIQQGLNIVVTVLLTYGLCLFVTLWVIRRRPAWRPLLLE